MAKKQTVNKTQAVRDYLKAHPKAMSGEIATALEQEGHQDHGGLRRQYQDQDQQDRTAKKAVKDRRSD